MTKTLKRWGRRQYSISSGRDILAKPSVPTALCRRVKDSSYDLCVRPANRFLCLNLTLLMMPKKCAAELNLNSAIVREVARVLPL